MAETKSSVALDPSNFEEKVILSDRPVLVDFWASWCGPCQMIAPAIEDLAEQFSGRVTVAKVDVDQNPDLAAAYGVRSIPTLVVFHEGQPVDRLVGAVAKEVIADRLEAMIKVA